MAMQRHFSVRDCHQRSITALGFHTARREFLTGFEDGMIKWWDLDSGRLSQSAAEHSGMVTNLLYWTETKLVISSSNDGTLIVWTSGAVVLDKIRLRSPIFSIAINLRRNLLVCGFKNHLSIYPLDEQKTCGHIINLKKSVSDYQHSDIVSCIVSLDSQIYTVGYDKKFLIFDTYQTPEKTCLRVVHVNPHAHDAGITHLLLVRERESTSFLTGSFDRTVGVWSQDGQLIQRLQHFTSEITGMCYVPSIKTVWITSGNGQPLVLDPRSGDIISNFVDTFQTCDDNPQIKHLTCLPETSHVIGSTRSQMIVWKYHSSGSVTILNAKHPLECLSYNHYGQVWKKPT
ncbi:p21-activated protein kinase-interacting protein 1-like [Ranitomeya imitator]|uniref:p21-activated protein kinase-interacting protein 1-like n=1 Tax=Ranitomeya imitator TaxID=111125 RepID=UPI0037E6F98B